MAAGSTPSHWRNRFRKFAEGMVSSVDKRLVRALLLAGTVSLLAPTFASAAEPDYPVVPIENPGNRPQFETVIECDTTVVTGYGPAGFSQQWSWRTFRTYGEVVFGRCTPGTITIEITKLL